jgi:nucleotide-binding universal stress UspA family protein
MVKIERILCPVDFSEFSHHALAYATAMASWYGARVTILHVHTLGVPPWVLASETGFSGAEAQRLSAEHRAQLTTELQRFATTTAASDVEVDFIVDEGDDPAAAIVRASESANASVIVLGTHGRSGVARIVLGSVTEHVLHLARCPVLAVPPHAKAAAIPRLFGHILVATDFSDAAAAGLTYALSLAQEANSRLTVLHVVEPPPLRDEDEWAARGAGVASVLEAMKASAARQLAAAIPVSARDWCRVTELLEVGRPHREILRVAAEQGVGLVVLGAHGYGVLERVFFGSTAHHVVRRAECPVLAVRAHRAAP